MKTIIAIAALVVGTGIALADEGKRCGKDGEFMGYGFRAQSTPCWVLKAMADANGATTAE